MSRELDALHRSAEHLHGVVDGLGPEEVRAPAYPTEWTVADVLSHLGSGATIMRLRLDGEVDMQAIWDEWNAKDPDTQAADALVADDALQYRVDSLTPDDQDRMRRRMAEFLVHQRVPVSCISLIVVRHEIMKGQVGAILAAHARSSDHASMAQWGARRPAGFWAGSRHRKSGARRGRRACDSCASRRWIRFGWG